MSFGRLERTQGPQPMSEINMTPLIDVMLVLVVIFIITAPLLASSIKLELPVSSAATTDSAPQSVQLVLDATGQLLLGGQPIDQQALVAALAALAARSPDTEVQLRGDAAVPYGRVVEVIGLAQEAGLHRIGFLAKPTRAAPLSAAVPGKDAANRP